jgi:hypothetical protein
MNEELTKGMVWLVGDLVDLQHIIYDRLIFALMGAVQEWDGTWLCRGKEYSYGSIDFQYIDAKDAKRGNMFVCM